MNEPKTISHARRTAVTRMALSAAAAAMPLLATPARAHTDKPHAPKKGPVVKEQKDWGIAGDAKQVRRTITIDMGDDMRFKPDVIDVREGETVRLAIRNRGKLLHELVIGTPDSLVIVAPDGSRIVFRSTRTGVGDIYHKLISGAGMEELLVVDADNHPHHREHLVRDAGMVAGDAGHGDRPGHGPL